MKTAVLIAVALAACGDGFSPPSYRGGDAHPIANAGTGSTFPLGAAIPLDGSGSFDPDGTIVSYQWFFGSKPMLSRAKIEDPEAVATRLTTDVAGTYQLELTVTDDAGNEDTSFVAFDEVQHLTSVDAGPDRTVNWFDSVPLQATGAPLGPAQCTWTVTSHPQSVLPDLTGATTCSPTLFANAPGVFVLSVTGKSGADVASDTVTVTVVADSPIVMTGNIKAFTYSPQLDRIVFVRDIGHADIGVVDPNTGIQQTINGQVMAPVSIAVDPQGQRVAVGGAQIGVASLVTLSSLGVYDLGVTPTSLVFGADDRVHAVFGAGSDTVHPPIASLDLQTGAVAMTPQPQGFPRAVGSPDGHRMFVADGGLNDGADDFYLWDLTTRPISAVAHAEIAQADPPVFSSADGTWAIANGVIVAASGTALVGHSTAFGGTGSNAVAHSPMRMEVASGSYNSSLSLYSINAALGTSHKMGAQLPLYMGAMPKPVMLAYSPDATKLYMVAETPAVDLLYVVHLP